MDDSEIGKKAWEIVRAYLESATPAQWHLFAAGSNYDDNAPGLLWLIDNPNVDRATALLIYWALGDRGTCSFLPKTRCTMLR